MSSGESGSYVTRGFHDPRWDHTGEAGTSTVSGSSVVNIQTRQILNHLDRPDRDLLGC